MRPALVRQWADRGFLSILLLVVTLLIGGCEPGGTTRDPGATAEPQTTEETPAGGSQDGVPVEVVKAPGGSVLVFVSVTIQGQGPYTFVLDTGASRTAISPDLAQELGLPEAGIQGEVSGVTGTQQVRLVEIESWSVDGVEFPPSTIVSIELPTVSNASRLGDLLGTDALEDMQGLLGSDILSGFGTIVIDYENQRLILGADIRTLETGR